MGTPLPKAVHWPVSIFGALLTNDRQAPRLCGGHPARIAGRTQETPFLHFPTILAFMTCLHERPETVVTRASEARPKSL